MINCAFISGHLDLTEEEFKTHYIPLIDEALSNGCCFVVGDAKGCDTMAQQYLKEKCYTESGNIFVAIYHMFDSPRNDVFKNSNLVYTTIGGYKSDDERDKAMTNESGFDIAWVRTGREKSGTAKNIKRRIKI